jgi:hypothetical protein
VPDTAAGSEVCGNQLDDDCDGEVDDADACALDHFLTYKVKKTPGDASSFPVGFTVTVDDPTWDGAGMYRSLREKALALPADKNGEGTIDPAIHLLSYQIREAVGQAKHARRVAVEITNQFHPAGNPLLLDTTRADRLLVPTLKDLQSPVGAPPDPQTHNVDHYKCYKVKASKTDATGTVLPKFPKILGVGVADQFEDRTYDLIKPLHLCNAVDKNGEGLKNAAAHLLCYKTKKSAGQATHTQRKGVHVHTQFATPLQVDSKRVEELCVPTDVINLGELK